MRIFLIKILNILLIIYASTWRFRLVDERILNIQSASNYLFSIWHNQIFPLVYYGRKRDIIILASSSKDGDLIASILSSWGYHMTRGSSTRGGLKAVRKIMDLKKLYPASNICLTVDGPVGPRYVVKPGAIFISKATNYKIVPLFAKAKHFIQFKSWDRFILPLPFTRIDIYASDAVSFDSDTSKEALKRDSDILTKLMNEKHDEVCPDYI